MPSYLDETILPENLTDSELMELAAERFALPDGDQEYTFCIGGPHHGRQVRVGELRIHLVVVPHFHARPMFKMGDTKPRESFQYEYAVYVLRAFKMKDRTVVVYDFGR